MGIIRQTAREAQRHADAQAHEDQANILHPRPSPLSKITKLFRCRNFCKKGGSFLEPLLWHREAGLVKVPTG